jgi:hypothetical protein
MIRNDKLEEQGSGRVPFQDSPECMIHHINLQDMRMWILDRYLDEGIS